MSYPARNIESKWQAIWKENHTYQVTEDKTKEKYYVLDMFPYPSGSGLHVGHPLGYIASDILARHKRMQGFQVLHPMGYDAFGLPAEQYAIQKGVHPAQSTEENIKRFRSQLELIGLSYDWSREVKTCDPSYYKWTQEIFLLLFGHFYDLESNKAQPIPILIERLEKGGSASANAHHSLEEPFTAEDWQSFSDLKRQEILMHYRLAYRKISYVNWCEALGTVLANDEVVNGVSERGGYPVVQKPMLQWSLRITAYAERLLSGLETLHWTEALKIQQENWIGKSTGAKISFTIKDHDEKIDVFTTRPDTLYGCTFMVMAPEHDLVPSLTTSEQKQAVEGYVKEVSSKSEIERMSDKSVSGAFTGAYAIHPFTEREIPIYISEYVLKDYGTGAIMAVPSNDERDHRFAEHFDLDIIDIIDMTDYPDASREEKVGTLKNSDFLNGMSVLEAIEASIQALEEKGIGQRQTNYRLRDANFSRQRYWGEPFPVLYDEQGLIKLVSKEDLPVTLPQMKDIRSENGKSPLSRNESWVHEIDGYSRETDTMPGFAGSSWYFLRYMDPSNESEMFSKEAVNYWKDVDCYVGGTEHAVGHLMYARFWHKFLYDLGRVPTQEPFKKLINQGMIQGRSLYIVIKKEDQSRRLHIPIHLANTQDELSKESFLSLIKEDNRFEDVEPDTDIQWYQNDEGEWVTKLEPEIEKMSKSKYNVVNPDEVIESYGTDCFRMFEMFLGPIEDHKPWDMQSITGVSKFINKFWSLFCNEDEDLIVTEEAGSKEEFKIVHSCIKKVNEDIERLSFNTCISAMMIAVNELRSLKCHKREVLEPLVALLSPFAPHMAEELNEKLGHSDSICLAAYPTHSEEYLVESEVAYPICINGKKRGDATFAADMTKDDLAKAAQELEIVQKWTEGKTIRKVIVVPNRMINVVVS